MADIVALRRHRERVATPAGAVRIAVGGSVGESTSGSIGGSSGGHRGFPTNRDRAGAGDRARATAGRVAWLTDRDPRGAHDDDVATRIRALIRSTGLTGLVRPASEHTGVINSGAMAGRRTGGAIRSGTVRSMPAEGGRSTTPPTTARSLPVEGDHVSARSGTVHSLPVVESDRGITRSATAGVGSDRILPVWPQLRRLLPGGGLRRGTTVAVGTSTDAATRGATSTLLVLLATASAQGCWCAVVGMPSLGIGAAAELGIALDRLALVPYPGPDWTTVVAALLDGVDVVVAAPPGPISATVASRLAARARQRGSILMPYGPWVGADVVVEPIDGGWQGLGFGRGRLRQRELVIRAQGRGSAARPRQVSIWLPDRPAAEGRPLLTIVPGAAEPEVTLPGVAVPGAVKPRAAVPEAGLPEPAAQTEAVVA